MLPGPYANFLTASTQASAALIGLLFVAISIAPQRVFGGEAQSHRQAQALSAFTALSNVFFISFASLVPNIPIGPVVTVVAIPAVLQTLALLALLSSWRSEGALWRGLFLFAASAAIYCYEMVVGVQLWQAPSNTGALTGLLELLLGAYAVGLGRAWELLGAPRSGFVAAVVAMVRNPFRRKPPDRKP